MSLEVSQEHLVLEVRSTRERGSVRYTIVFLSQSGHRVSIGVPKEFWDTIQPGDRLVSAYRKA